MLQTPKGRAGPVCRCSTPSNSRDRYAAGLSSEPLGER
jgi:hypothetical protein